jgi:hypothetical protein
MTWMDDQPVVFWGENEASIVDGKNTEVYEKDEYFPASPVKVISQAQMRKWRYIRLMFTPAQFNPVTGKVRLTTEAQVNISYKLAQEGEAITLALNDTLMDDKAAEILYNFDQAQPWYQPAGPGSVLPTGMGYAIITTNQIAAGSALLDDFVMHKQSLGYTVEVVTESQFGGLTGPAPNGAAEKIRQWLINNYASKQILYVLLVGNPDPDDPTLGSETIGDIPMKMTWTYAGGYPEAPTDYFFADLTGNWNLDGDIYVGEYWQDTGPGGVDFSNEVYVGRIPVYTSVPGWQAALDSILQKTIDYDNEASPTWRKAALLPMSFSDWYTDGAYLAEHMKNDYLSAKGYLSYTMYQQMSGADCDSGFVSDEPLTDGAVRNHWQGHPYGIVTWWAHGWNQGASLYCGGGTLFSSPDASSLSNIYPAYVFPVSCSNGYPEDSQNLGYALLKNGAIGTVPASRVSWYVGGQWSPNPSWTDNANLGYNFSQGIANNETAAQALYDQKSTMNSEGEAWYMNLLVFNLYGDPSTRIEASTAPPPLENDDFDDAEVIPGMPFNDTLDVSNATSASDDPAFSNCNLNPGLATVWYKFTPAVSGKLTIDTFGSTYDTVLGVWSGARGALKPHACNDDRIGTLQSSVKAFLVAGTTYSIEVAQFGWDPDDLAAKAGPKSAAEVGTGDAMVLQLNATFDPNVIFYDGFGSGDLSGWSSCITDGGDLSVSSAADLGWGYYYTMQIAIDDNHAAYCVDERPTAQKTYRARFYFDPNSIAMVNGDAHYLFYGMKSPSPLVVRVDLRRNANQYQLRAGLVNDGTTWKWSSWFNITDTTHYIEFLWKAATGAGKNNGSLTLWIDGAQKNKLTGVDNDTRRIDFIRLGAVGSVDSGTRGMYYFDEFESRKDSQVIGP